MDVVEVERRQGGREEEVKLCREPFSMEKPFSAMWEVKLVFFCQG